MLDLFRSKGARPVIFTDLDGTLLDHHSYDFSPAADALAQIKAMGIDLIINSSKTQSEIVPIQRSLGICQAYICENGAAVYWPEGAGNAVSWHSHGFGQPRPQILATLAQLRQQHDYDFVGFADMSVADISKLTGLGEADARFAATRAFSEPLLWRDSEAHLLQFRQQLQTKGLVAVLGGRFWCVTGAGAGDKGAAMRWWCQRMADEANGHPGREWRPVVSIALGDSPNDHPMLNAADIAVVIRSERSHLIKLDRPKHVIRTQLPGPAGWQAAMEEILPIFS